MTTKEMVLFLRDLSKQCAAANADLDYYIGGRVDAPSPDAIDEIADTLERLSTESERERQ